MRANLEDNWARRIRHKSAMFSTLQRSISGSYRLNKDSPQFHFLNPGAVDLDVFLPPIEPNGGQLYIIGNIPPSTANLLVRDTNGALVRTVVPGSINICFSSAEQWFLAPLSIAGAGGAGVSTVGAVDNTKLSGFSDSSGLLIQAVGLPAAGLVRTPGGNLALANDLAALEALNGTGVIYYRSGPDTWNPVGIGAGMQFVGGTLSTSGGQPLDADLTSIASQTAVGKWFFRKGEGDWAPVTLGDGFVFDPVTGDLETTAPPGMGDVTAIDGPISDQLSMFVGPTTIKGINVGNGLQVVTSGPTQTLDWKGVTISDAVPTPPVYDGQLWWESDTGTLFMRYTDVSSSQWVAVGGAGAIGLMGVTDGSNAAAGQIGEYAQFTTVAGPTLAVSTVTNCATLPLTAGDWDVWMMGNIISPVPGGIELELNTASALSGAWPRYVIFPLMAGASYSTVNLGPLRFNSASSFTINLMARAGIDNQAFNRILIAARRRR